MPTDNLPSPTFCVLPWIHLATRTWGSVTPCCVGEVFEDNLNETTFSLAWNGPSIRNLRKQMLNGKRSSICQKCYDEEDAGVPSHRTRSNGRWKERFSFKALAERTHKDGNYQGKIRYLDLRLGNKCNLECNMCNSRESRRWYLLAPKIYAYAQTRELKSYIKNQMEHFRFYPSKSWYFRKEIKADLVKHIPDLELVVVAGGEPLLIDEHYQFLDECTSRGESGHINLHYHTNGTSLRPELFDSWQHFKSVIIFLSLDGIDGHNNYIRYPTNWKKLEDNIERLHRDTSANVNIVFLHTVGIFNILYFFEFMDWIKRKNFAKFKPHVSLRVHSELIHHPYYLSCQILPPSAKKAITKMFYKYYDKDILEIERFKSLIDFMNKQNNSQFLPVFRDYYSSLDRVRGTSFKDTFPQLAAMLYR